MNKLLLELENIETRIKKSLEERKEAFSFKEHERLDKEIYLLEQSKRKILNKIFSF